MPFDPRVLRLCFAVVLSVSALGASAGVAPAGGFSAPDRSARYIIQLAEPPLATYTGTLSGLPATAPNLAAAAAANGSRSADALAGAGGSSVNGGAARLDLVAPAAIAYAAHLARAQDRVEQAIARIAPGARRLYDYRVAFNGLTVRLTPREAEAVTRLPGVIAVTPEAPVEWLMDAANPQIEAPEAWSSPRVGGRENAGQGVRIAIIDTGISAAHEMFDDTGFSAPPGFPKASLTIGTQTTVYDQDETARYTNAKVIVARAYMNPELLAANDDNPTNPLPSEHPHGTHVAGIAAGDVVRGGPNRAGSGEIELSGVAPGAYLMSYKSWHAYTPEFVKMIDDAVADGADVINNSWGTALMNIVDPEHHPVSQAFKAAAAANVVVVASAGNSGLLGEATLGGPHQLLGDVITVGMVQTGRGLAYYVQATGAGLADNLKQIPAQYGDVADAWSTVDASGFTGDACAGAGATALAGKVLVVDASRGCATPVVAIPPGLQPYFAPWAQQLAGAQRAGAAAVVLYSATPNVALDFDTFSALRSLVAGFETLPPTFFIAGGQAKALADWAAAHPELRLRLDVTPERSVDRDLTDLANPATSQGPAPGGDHAPLKPDISAPGVDILSALARFGTGEPAGYGLLTGTSMAGPCVAGAAAVLRQAWPDWTPAQVKAALMTTADPIVTTPDGQHIAPVRLQGAGRLNLAQAVDPGALVLPSSLNLGPRRGGTVELELRATDARAGVQGDVVYQLFHEPGPDNSAVVPELPAEITVPAGGSATFTARFNLDGVPVGAYDGRILLESDNHVLRVVYGLRVPGPAKDVLLINNRRSYNIQGGAAQFGDTTDYREYWMAALDAAELSYDVWTITQSAGNRDRLPPLSELERYRLVIVAGGDSKVPLEATPSGMTPLQMYLLGGGRLLASGSQWPHQTVFGGAQAAGATYLLNRYFAGFELRQNDVAPGGAFRPLRLFDKPVQLAARASAGAAGNGGTVDVGRPLVDIITRPPSAPGQPQPPDNPFTPVAIDRVKPHIRGYLETASGGSVMTGVSVEATLEAPERAAGIPWRALFAAFPIEAVTADSPEQLSRTELLSKIFAWAVEPESLPLTLTGPAEGETFAPLAFRAQVGTAPDFGGAAGFRWDAGDGRAYFTTTSPMAGITYTRPGTYTVRVELTTRAGHSHVAATTAAVAWGEPRVYLPVGVREGVIGEP